MKLFDVPANVRIRATSKLVRWVDHGQEFKVGENVTWQGTTTECFEVLEGVRRRLIVDHTALPWTDHGLWQINCECTILNPSQI